MRFCDKFGDFLKIVWNISVPTECIFFYHNHLQKLCCHVASNKFVSIIRSFSCRPSENGSETLEGYLVTLI